MSRERIIVTELHATNEDVWLLGYRDRGGFHVRKVVWGNMLARAERREGEEIRRGKVLVTSKAQGRTIF
jgi:hypothetical protein